MSEEPITNSPHPSGTPSEATRWKTLARLIAYSVGLVLIISFWFAWSDEGFSGLNKTDFTFLLVAGFLAQLVDGALGMGYGITGATILLSSGVNPAMISAGIHTSELFSSGLSGYSHYRFGNVDKNLFRQLLVPGVIGSIIGAILIIVLGNELGSMVRPLLAAYTLFMGVTLLVRAFRTIQHEKDFNNYRVLAGAGGFLDAFAGGGWGPVVTSTLISKGHTPNTTIGTVSLTEFFVTLASSITFVFFLGISHWQVIAGLILGGLIAAPVAALIAGRIPRKIAMVSLGILVVIWSARILFTLL
ncbi:MAG: sulfite exporter TauE/SafE family protein [Bacteroidetes bacterium]|nr:sulfite exporter TauE/SafE family protein [Bacteroidota bacterium]